MRHGSNNDPKNQDNRGNQAKPEQFKGGWLTKLSYGECIKVGEATIFIRHIQDNYVTIGVVAGKHIKIEKV